MTTTRGARRFGAAAALAATLSWAGAARAAQSALTERCGTIDQPVKYGYCIAQTQSPPSGDVIYVMHGGGGNEHDWRWYAGAFEAWERGGLQVPAVVTVSFGRGWILAEKNAAPQSGLFETFTREVMPKMETLAVGHPARRRFILGCSMGGINGAELLLQSPPGTFDRAVLISPALMDVSPWATPSQAEDFSRRTGIPADEVSGFSAHITPYASDEAFWNERLNPITIVRTLGARMPPTLVATNVQDQVWGGGGRVFARAAIDAGAAVTAAEWPGGHCTIDPSKVAEFLKP
jgi:pimeloyl-ACP methyl ester carboxylesterase